MKSNKQYPNKEFKPNHHRKTVDFIDYSSEILMKYLTKQLDSQEIAEMTKVIHAYPVYELELVALRLMLDDYDDNIDEILTYADSFEINIEQCIEEIEEEDLELCVEEDLDEENLIAELLSIVESENEDLDVSSFNENEEQKTTQKITSEIDAINQLRRHLESKQTNQGSRRDTKDLKWQRLNSSLSDLTKALTSSNTFKSQKMRSRYPIYDTSSFLNQKTTIHIGVTALICQELGKRLITYNISRVTDVKSFLINLTELIYFDKISGSKLERYQGSNVCQLLPYNHRKMMEKVVTYFSPYFDIIEYYCYQKMDDFETIDWDAISTLLTQVSEDLALLEDNRSTNNAKLIEITAKIWEYNQKEKCLVLSRSY